MENINELLSEAEAQVYGNHQNVYSDDGYKIKVCDAVKGGIVDVDVYPEHTLGQVLTVVAEEIGVDPCKNIVFTNKRTGETTRELNITLKEFKILEDDVLKMSADGVVA